MKVSYGMGIGVLQNRFKALRLSGFIHFYCNIGNFRYFIKTNLPKPEKGDDIALKLLLFLYSTYKHLILLKVT